MDELKRLYFEPTSKCNLSCTMCFRHTWFDEKFADMPLDTFKRALDTAPDTVETVFFGGMGEPLFHKDIVEMVALAAKRFPRVEALSNGTLLTEERAAALLEAGISRMWISIDSFSPEAYERIRRKSHYDLIINNITAYNRLRNVNPLPEYNAELGIAFVAMKSNIGELALLPDFVKKYKVNEVNVSNVFPSDVSGEDEALYSSSLEMEIGALHENGAPVINLPFMDWSSADVWGAVQPILSSPYAAVNISDVPFVRKRRACRFIDRGCAFVRHDGDVSPCMAVLHSSNVSFCRTPRRVEHHSFGNVNETPLKDVWYGEEYTHFRRTVREFSFSPCMQCGHCENAFHNKEDCCGNPRPTCGACLWSEGIISCP